jgi:hypothetical protein
MYNVYLATWTDVSIVTVESKSDPPEIMFDFSRSPSVYATVRASSEYNENIGWVQSETAVLLDDDDGDDDDGGDA